MGEEIGGDKINAEVGEQATTVAVGKDNSQVVTTTTTRVEPNTGGNIQVNPVISMPANLPPTNDTIILYLMQQNNVLAKLDSGLGKIGERVDEQGRQGEARFRTLEEKLDAQSRVSSLRAETVEKKLDEQNLLWEGKFRTLGVNQSETGMIVETLVKRLKSLEETNANLEHLSLVRAKQSDAADTKITGLSEQFAAVLAEVKAMGETQKQQKRGIDPMVLVWAFLFALVIGGAFFLGLGFYLMGWGG